MIDHDVEPERLASERDVTDTSTQKEGNAQSAEWTPQTCTDRLDAQRNIRNKWKKFLHSYDKVGLRALYSGSQGKSGSAEGTSLLRGRAGASLNRANTM
jgi:hypothetical protein